jgi:hypothetical protein
MSSTQGMNPNEGGSVGNAFSAAAGDSGNNEGNSKMGHWNEV